MRLTLDALLVLDAIERGGSFAAAAEELHRVPSAITYTVHKLEQDLDVNLFDRSGHRARLTEAGRRLLQDGRHLLRAATELERSVKRVATGWEAELRIAVSDLIPLPRLFPLVASFYAQGTGTRIRIGREVLGGTWDALASGRSDLVIGASGDGPPGGGYATRLVGEIEFVFVVAPDHPLAEAPEPLGDEDLLCFRAVAAADSSRHLPPRTTALLSGQDVLTLPDMDTKLAAQRFGLGIGYVPRRMVAEDLAAGRLVEKQVASSAPMPQVFLAWRSDDEGRALRWILRELEDHSRLAALLR